MDAKIARLEKVMAQHEQRLNRLSDSVELNNKMTKSMYEIFSAVQGGFKVLGWLGAMAKFMWPLAALIATIVVFFKTGVWNMPK